MKGRSGSLSVLTGNLSAMEPDDRAATWLLANQRGVISREQVLANGVTEAGLRHRLRRGGPWQRLLPGVYVTTTGQPTREQRQIAAMLYAGRASVITGPAALRNYGIRGPETQRVTLLVPWERRRASRDFVVIHRTRRLPREWTSDGPLRFALAARAVADAVREIGNRPDARAIVGSAVQKSRCTVSQLADELAAGPVRGSAQLRAVLAEVADGVRSAAEGDFHALVRTSGLPAPTFNARLFLDGVLLGVVDAWWPQAGVAVEVDSREWHFEPAAWEATMRRHARLTAAGISVIHVSPLQIRTEPGRILRDIDAALRHGRAAAGIVTLPAVG
jgi:very-short-patch-repair endonuclease